MPIFRFLFRALERSFLPYSRMSMLCSLEDLLWSLCYYKDDKDLAKMPLSIGPRAACNAGLCRAMPGIPCSKGNPLGRMMTTANYLETGVAYV